METRKLTGVLNGQVGRFAEHGFALVTSLAILLVVGVLIVGSILTTQIELFVSNNDSSSAQAQYVAQAGLQTYKTAMFQNYRWLEGQSEAGTATDPCQNTMFEGIDFLRTGDPSLVRTWDADNRIVLPAEDVLDLDGGVIGSYVVTLFRDPSNATIYSIQSVGVTNVPSTARQATSTARALFSINNSSVLEQAIFAGAGSGMRFINGNARIYGGVYVVGDEEEPTKTVASPTGNFGLFNNYALTSTDVGQYLLEPNRTQNNLCAALRVQFGRVEVGGSASLGTPTDKLLAVKVGQSSGDITYNKQPIEGDADGTCQNNKGVCSIALVGPFDIENPPKFPLLDVEPKTELCPAGKTWRECIQDEATADGIVLSTEGGSTMTLVAPSLVADGLQWADGDCQSFLDTAASQRAMTFSGIAVDCRLVDTNGVTVAGFRYDLDGTAATFETFGHINLRGVDVGFDRTTRYTARSTVDGEAVPHAGMSIEKIADFGGSFTVSRDFISSALFPANVLTIVAEVNINQTGNQSVMTAPVYAANLFRIRSGSTLLGQIITNEFCSTSATGTCNPAGVPPDVFFVPTGDNRPRSFRAIVPRSGIPVFAVLSYEMR